MDLTPANKDHINSLTYLELLRGVRYAPLGDPWFQGETGTYWGKRMRELRSKPGGNAEHVRCSKALG